MDKITDKLAALPPDATYFSLEFFPPKTQAGFSNLQARLSRMAQALRPLFVTITWGAGGSTASKSLELAEVCQRQLGLTTCLHLTCTNMNRKLVDEALREAKDLGIRNILALRGDPPRSEEYNLDEEEDSNKDFTWAVDLVRYIRKNHGDYFCVGVAGYPEGHSDESHPEHQSVEHDLPFLVEKTSAGANFIMTQLSYDIYAYSKYEQTLRSHPSGVFKTIPILPGLMPIQSYQVLKRVTKLSHAKVPAKILERVEKVKTDDEAVKSVGVGILSELVTEIRNLPSPPSLPRGLHFYTLNLEKSVAYILERCNLIPDPESPDYSAGSGSDSDTAVIVTHEDATIPSPSIDNSIGESGHGNHARRRASSVNAQPHNRLIVDHPVQTNKPIGRASRTSSQDHEASSLLAGVPATLPDRTTNLLISEGLGSLGREATWDDFPNGRWGPSNSPAFGEIDGYGPSLHVSPAQARKLWGFPTTHADITNIFKRHVLGELPCVPWSDDSDQGGGDGALREETFTIQKELLSLIEGQGWWTIASQPAVNGIRSSDPIFGWGPQDEGYVFQKAFVEFFMPRDQWEKTLRPRLQELGNEEIAYLVTDDKGQFESSTTGAPASAPSRSASLSTSVTSSGTTGMVNAVTWGVFRGREILTPTIIEEVSFRAWGEEAYGIWEEWRRVFPRGSSHEKFLQECKQSYVLVNCVGQKFGEGEGKRLWDVLLGKALKD